ncbi:MAG: site-specific integrase [Candidatus Bathyarchaeota archaeon]|nr:site-specific integrase [Candidatus Bathyarchaeota archaeon]
MFQRVGGEVLKECPNCHNGKIWKAGKIQTLRGTVQRYQCQNCLTRFSEKTNTANPNISNMEVILENKINGEIESKILEFLWWMKKQGYKEATITTRGLRLRRLVNLKADLNDPETIKSTIALQTKWKESQKEAMVFAYDLYAKWAGLKWERPHYTAVRTLPFIPQEREIDDLIAGCTKNIALFLQIDKETGARSGEIYGINTEEQIDMETRTLKVTAEKGSNPRIFKISNKLYNMLLQANPKNGKLFYRYKNLNCLRRSFDRQRKRIALKFGNTRLNKITFHTLRHWKGTMEYHKTKDILHVMSVLGHKNIKNTLLYVQLQEALFQEENSYICKVAKTPLDRMQLIEQNFEFVEQTDGMSFYRKRKSV